MLEYFGHMTYWQPLKSQTLCVLYDNVLLAVLDGSNYTKHSQLKYDSIAIANHTK